MIFGGRELCNREKKVVVVAVEGEVAEGEEGIVLAFDSGCGLPVVASTEITCSFSAVVAVLSVNLSDGAASEVVGVVAETDADADGLNVFSISFCA